MQPFLEACDCVLSMLSANLRGAGFCVGAAVAPSSTACPQEQLLALSAGSSDELEDISFIKNDSTDVCMPMDLSYFSLDFSECSAEEESDSEKLGSTGIKRKRGAVVCKKQVQTRRRSTQKPTVRYFVVFRFSLRVKLLFVLPSMDFMMSLHGIRHCQ